MHENICQKLHPDKLKMQQKVFGGRELIVKGREWRKGKGRGRKGEEKEKGKSVPGATIFHLHPLCIPLGA